MNADEIRQKAIECADDFTMKCEENFCKFCSLELEDVKARVECKTIYGYERGFADGVEEGRNEVITELLETSKHDELSQKIAWDILNRGIERGKELVLNDVKRLLYKTPTDKVAEIKCDDGEIRNRPLIDIAKVYEILEKVKDKECIREDTLNKFAEWCKTKGYSCYDWRMLIEQYKKEQSGERT